MSVRPIPEGYHTVTPYLIVKGASQAIDFYKSALGAVEVMRLAMPDGTVAHAEIQVGNSRLMLADEFPDMGALGPVTIGGSPVHMMIYVEDCDAAIENAVALGAISVRPVADQFYGDRSGTVKDPFGHQWTLSTHKEDVAPDELQRRFEAMMSSHAG